MADTGAGQPETVLRLAGITKRFGALTANDAISLELRRGEIVGLLGENGAGKTTLMNILFGHYVADAGTIEVGGKVLPAGAPSAAIAAGIGMVHQHFTLADNLTVLDNIMLGTESLWRLRSDRPSARRRVGELSGTFGLAVDSGATVASLSVGERQRVEILKALYRRASILILDEPTAVLTPQETASLFDTLQRFVANGLSIIFISHKLNEILAVCHRVAVLRAGRMVADRSVESVTRSELAELMVGRAIAPAKSTPQDPGEPVLRLDAIVARREPLALDGISLVLRAGEISGIAGVSGNGQSLLADVIGGTHHPNSGRLTVRQETLNVVSPGIMIAHGMARIPEDRHAEGLIGDMTVAENAISESYRTPDFLRFGLIDLAGAKVFAERIIADYQIKCPSPEVRARLLSGGNMQKLILGRVMARAPAMVLANQPTRGLDVGAVNYVHEQLLAARRRGAAILLISEDLDELLSLSDRIAVMYRGRLSSFEPRAAVSTTSLGLMMAGHGMDGGRVRDAA
ncbi:MAG: ABC transporter ATP-binding protein [Pseudomonadota bacterium]|nr:ABC transporter ATP-binding protein [Pseudomonadota bacterium]